MTPSADDLAIQATQARREGRMDEARELWERAVALDPTHAVALNALGLLALPIDPEQAASLFSRATASDPTAPALQMNRATAARAMGDHRLEQEALAAALALDQRHLMANLRMAELLDRIGEGGAAVRHWQGLATMLADEADLSPELMRLRDTATARLRTHGERLGAEADALLAADRHCLSPLSQRRLRRCADVMAGRNRIYRNDCHGLHYPFLPADEFFDRDLFPWFEELERAWPVIRDELRNLLAQGHRDFAPYVQLEPGVPANKWTPLDQSPDWTALHLWRHGERKAAADACPRTAALVERLPLARLPRRAPNVFFSILQPGAHLPAHTGVTNTRAIVHLPLIVPPGCRLRVGGETQVWREGEAFAFDDTIEHEAWNTSGEARAVLILDTWNPHLLADEREMVAKLFDLADTVGQPQGFSD